MSCDGCISVAHLKSGKMQPSLKFACAHPSLTQEWKELFNEIGIKTCIDKDNANWGGIHGLMTTNIQSILRFQRIGGFYPTFVKVQNGNYGGLYKNKVLDGVCKWFSDRTKDIDKIITNSKWGREDSNPR